MLANPISKYSHRPHVCLSPVLLLHQFLIRVTVWMGKQLWRDTSAVSRGGRAWRGGTEAAISNPCSGWDSEWIWKVSRNSISNPLNLPRVISENTHPLPSYASRGEQASLSNYCNGGCRPRGNREWSNSKAVSASHISNSGFSMRIRQFQPLRVWKEIIILLYSWSLSIKSLLRATEAFFSEFY